MASDKSRIKAEWIKHIEELVEFYICLGGTTGSVVAQRKPGYKMQAGWRAMLDADLSPGDVQAAAQWLKDQDLPVQSRMIPDPTCDGERERGILELEELTDRVDDDLFLQGLVEGTDTPSNWQGFGPLPSGADALRNTRIIAAIVQSAETDERVRVAQG